jgi:hypothetical protein
MLAAVAGLQGASSAEESASPESSIDPAETAPADNRNEG